eukprot:915691-Prorocentrum_minimum.AAC.3
MGKKGGKEKGKKKDKASAKPETMSDAEWALYNNVAELVMVRMATLSGVAFILFGWWFILPSWICNESQPRSNLRSTKENRKAVFRVPVPSQLAMSAYVRKNLRGPSPLNTVAVTIDRGTAALYLWQMGTCTFECFLTLLLASSTSLYLLVTAARCSGELSVYPTQSNLAMIGPTEAVVFTS